MGLFRKAALPLLVGFAVAGAMLPPDVAAARQPTVFKKLERFLAGGSRKPQSRKQKQRSGKKSRNQAGPKARPAPREMRPGEQEKVPPDAAPGVAATAPGAVLLPLIVAVPLPRPTEGGLADGPEIPAGTGPQDASPPLPSPAPRTPTEAAAPRPGRDASQPAGDAGPSRPALHAADEETCRAGLLALGAEFEARPPESDPGAGCAVPQPVFVTRFSKSVTLEPGGLMNCAMAEATARFVRDVVQPAARKEMGSELAGIGQASAYVCRTRHGKERLSEHAFGNALDIARFSFADGAAADVGPAPGEKGGRFLAVVRKAACGPFKTVLGPGSDPDHATHFHLDLAQRRRGATFCQ